MRELAGEPFADQHYGLLSDCEIEKHIKHGILLVRPYDSSRLADTGYYLRFYDEAEIFCEGKRQNILFSNNGNRITLKPNMVILLKCIEEISLPDNIYARLRANDNWRLGFSSMGDIKIQSAYQGNCRGRQCP